MPGQKYSKADGTSSYVPVIEFVTKAARDRFQKQAIEAVGDFLGENIL